MTPLDRFALAELAELVDYPGPSFGHVLEECRRHAGRLEPGARADLRSFLDWARTRDPVEVEELYAATFDSDEACALEIGWHLYGEAYQRGVFLVEMRRRLRELGIEEGSELPDHLSHVLRWLARALEPERPPAAAREAERIVRFALVPALASVCAGLERKSSPWLPLLRALGRGFDPAFTPRRCARADEVARSVAGESAGGCR